MVHIKNEVEYNAAMERIEELLLVVNEDTPENDRNSIELVLLSNLVADYDEAHYPISSPTLADVLKLRMYEMGLTQKKIAEMLGVSPSRISDYLNGRSEPTLSIAREINRKLSIDASIILGV
ncbi:MAG: helix-turn-helix domain-containing protein [Rikenellaceae bacterium]